MPIKSKGIMGSFFFENEQGEAVTVNGDRYRDMLNKFLFTKIEEEHIGNIWFQTGRHYVSHLLSYARCFAPCFWRSHYQPQSWCRLATSELRFDTVGLLFVVLRRQARDNWRFKEQYSCNHRVGYCVTSRGSHLNEIIFHYYPQGLYFQIKKEI